MAKKKKSFDDTIKDMIHDELSDIISDDDSGNTIQNEEDLQLSSAQDTEKDAEIINKLLQSFPSTEGFYGKLYRRSPNGKLEFKHHIDLLEEVEDPELEIMNLVKERGWEDGDYILRVFKRGQPDCKKTISWRISIQSKNPMMGGNVENIQDKLSELRGIMTVVRDVTTPSAKPEDTTKLMSEAFKSGIDIAKGSMSSSESTRSGENNTMMSFMMQLLKELVAAKQPVAAAPLQDPFDLLLKMKQLGMIKMAGDDSDKEKEDPIEQVSRITELIHAVAPFTGNTPPEKPSAIMELVRILGPQVPKIVENITGTINKVAEISKIKTAERFGLNPAEIEHMPQMTEEIPLQETSIKKSEVIPSMNPIVKQIHDAVNNNDITYYAQLQNLMKIYVNKDIIENLISGEVVIESFLTSLSTMLNQPFLTDDKTKLYFTNFIEHLKAEKEANTIIAKCLTCETEYDFSTLTDFELDTKICDCGGMLEAVKKSTSNNGAKDLENLDKKEEIKV